MIRTQRGEQMADKARTASLQSTHCGYSMPCDRVPYYFSSRSPRVRPSILQAHSRSLNTLEGHPLSGVRITEYTIKSLVTQYHSVFRQIAQFLHSMQDRLSQYYSAHVWSLSVPSIIPYHSIYSVSLNVRAGRSVYNQVTQYHSRVSAGHSV